MLLDLVHLGEPRYRELFARQILPLFLIVLLQLLIEIKSNLSAFAKSKGRRMKLAVGEKHVTRTDLQD